MREVLLALLPGIACAWWFFGWGIIVNIVLAALACVFAEAGMLAVRGRPVAVTLTDTSAVLTGVLLALALPPLAPAWLPVVGAVFAIVVAKQLYGGLGYNPFNPAMIGYVVLLISFPREMTQWSAPVGLGSAQLGLADSLAWSLHGVLPGETALDALTLATPLDSVKISLGLGQMFSEIMTAPQFGRYGGLGWEWINFGYLLGGLYLVYRRLIDWRIPVGMLGALFAIALAFHGSDADGYPHLVPSVQRRGHAWRILHRYRSGHGQHHAARAVDLRRRHRPHRLSNPHLGRLSGRRCLRGIVDEYGRADDRPLHQAARVWPRWRQATRTVVRTPVMQPARF